MLSLEVRQFAEKLNQLSLEDKQWLLQKLADQINSDNALDLVESNDIDNNNKTFNITPSPSGSGFYDTAINHDQVLANSILSES